jgi:predicted Zn-dependent protease
MNESIHTITNINGYTLIVFYTSAQCWQFRVISPGGAVFGERKIYYTAEAAEAAGRDWVCKG